jgi:hypothetical protein
VADVLAVVSKAIFEKAARGDTGAVLADVELRPL